MANIQGFDATQHDITDNFTPIPNGDYKVVMEDSEMRDTNAGTGTYLSFTFSVIEGEFKGRKLFHMANMTNPSADCVAIGAKSLAQIGIACKIPKPTDTAQFHNIPLMAKVVVEDDDYKGEGAKKNVIKHFSGLGQVSQAQAVAVVQGSSAGAVVQANAVVEKKPY